MIAALLAAISALVVTGNADVRQAVVRHGLLPRLVVMVSSASEAVQDSALWLVSSLSTDVQFRDTLLAGGVVASIVAVSPSVLSSRIVVVYGR